MQSFFPYLDKSRGLSPVSDIPDSVKDEKHYEEDDIISKDWLREETGKKLRLQLNRKDRDSGIQLSEGIPKKSGQDCLIKQTPVT